MPPRNEAFQFENLVAARWSFCWCTLETAILLCGFAWAVWAGQTDGTKITSISKLSISNIKSIAIRQVASVVQDVGLTQMN